MSEFCHQLLPALLTEGCEVPDNAAQEVARDVLARAEAIASLKQEHIGGYDTEQILHAYPELSRDDVVPALDYASAVDEEKVVALGA